MGVAYADSCTTFKISYANAYINPSTNPIGTSAASTAPATRDQTLLVELDLRTLGDVRGSLDLDMQ